MVYSLLPDFSKEDNASEDKDWSKKGLKLLDTINCMVFELSIQKSNLTYSQCDCEMSPFHNNIENGLSSFHNHIENGLRSDRNVCSVYSVYSTNKIMKIITVAFIFQFQV